MNTPTREDLIGAFQAVVASADPGAAVARHLSAENGVVSLDDIAIGMFPPERITVVGIGKAGFEMAREACDITGSGSAIVATPYPSGTDPRITVLVGGHPVPDEASVAAGEALLAAVRACGADDLVIAVVSGGGSAAAEIPIDGVTVEDLVELNTSLLASGMSIEDMNEVRAACSALKGGRLAEATSATVVTLVLSDVVGAGPEFVASGPTIPSRIGERAATILASLPDSISVPQAIEHAAATVQPLQTEAGPVSVVGGPGSSATTARAYLEHLGFKARVVTSSLTGEARAVATEMVAASKPGVVCIAAGETTVTVVGDGVGGRNQEAAMAVMESIATSGGIFAALGTDGIDGPTTVAGAVVDVSSHQRAIDAGWDVAAELAANNSNPVLVDVDAVVRTGPTGTNVCDLWMWWLPAPRESRLERVARGAATSSAFGRTVDWRYASNRFAIAVSFLSLVVFSLFAWWDGRFTYIEAFTASVAVFLAWAIGRELDPGHTMVAGIACAAAFGVVFVGVPGALIVFAVLIAARAVAGTTGRSLRWGDLLALGVAGFASGGAVWSWSIGLVIFAWLKSAPDAGRRRWWGMAALGVGFAVGWYLGDLDPVVFSAQAALFGSVVVVVTLISLIDVAAPGRTDSGKSEVLGFRVRLARLSVGIICLSAVLIGGSDALIRVGPAACALAATALMALASTVGVVKTGSDS